MVDFPTRRSFINPSERNRPGIAQRMRSNKRPIMFRLLGKVSGPNDVERAMGWRGANQDRRDVGCWGVGDHPSGELSSRRIRLGERHAIVCPKWIVSMGRPRI